MTKNEAKAVAVVGGVCTIIVAASAAEKSRGWKEIHKFAAAVGTIAAILGMFG